MTISGAQVKQAVGNVPGAATGQPIGWDQIASLLDGAAKTIGIRTRTEMALFCATLAQESAYFRTTQEYGTGQRYAPYIGRTWQQLTWVANYSAFGKYAKALGQVTDASYFVNNPARLADARWAAMGGAFFWTMDRTGNAGWGQYKSLIDLARQTGSILAVSRAVNVGNPGSSVTPNGMTERTKLFNAFMSLGDSITPGTAAPSVPSQQTQQTTPAGAIPGTAAMVLKAANDLWNQYKGKLYAYAWPGWRELPYGITNGYWCAAFVSLALKKATGFDWAKTVGKSGPAYCPALVVGMSKSSYWDEVKYRDAQGGDVVFFFDKNGVAYHTGLVEFGPTSAGHDMRTIEGNTSTPGMSSSMSAGGTLSKKTRDDRYYTMRIFRPTYWTAAPTVTTDSGTAAKDAVDVVAIDETAAPNVSTITIVDDPGLASNPIDLLNVSEAFLESIGQTSTRWCRVSAGMGGQVLVDNLPVVADASKISVDATRTVRRQASLTFQPDPYDETHAGLRELLSRPGLEIYVEVGFSWGTYHEAVPVFDGIRMSSKWDWETGRITLEASDRMVAVAWKGFETECMSNAMCKYTDAIRGLITEADPRAQVIDLTGNTETMPSVVWGLDGGASRIDAVMELAMAIGAEVFKSPARDYYVIRPIATPGVSAKWTTRQGATLVSLSEVVSDEKLRNHIEAKSTRSDGPTLQAGWKIVDTSSPFHESKILDRMGTWSTALLTDRDQLEAAAKSIVDRLIGARMNIEFTQLVNPLMEAGDPNRVTIDEAHWDIIVDSFEVPLGTQATTGAQARALETEGVS